MTINMFRGKYHFLSNFHRSQLTYKGVRYQNAEAAFHAQKDPSRAYQFKNLQPNEAKRLGRRVTLRKDWEDVKDTIMYGVVRQKFIENKTLAKRLLATGKIELIEGNWWNDTYWGVCEGKGQNKLGNILMKVRDELK